MRTEDDPETRKLQVVLVVLSRLAFPHLRAAIQVLKCAEGSAAKDWEMAEEKGCPALSFSSRCLASTYFLPEKLAEQMRQKANSSGGSCNQLLLSSGSGYVFRPNL